MIHKVRLEHAHYLLDTGVTITEIAMRCGYADHSAFTRQFKNTDRVYAQSVPRGDTQKEKARRMDRKN